MKIGLFGFGTVAKGFLKGLEMNPELGCSIQRICIKNVQKRREIVSIPFSSNPADIFSDPEIDVIVELTNDPEAALEIIKKSLQAQIPCISANKKAIAKNLTLFANLQQEYNTPLLYEAAVGGAIPILNSIDLFFSNQKINEINGILNGTSNYILTKMDLENTSYEEALDSAISLGFAESDPYDDINGWDVGYKSIILAFHAFGQRIEPDELQISGIDQMRHLNLRITKNKKIKLISRIWIEDQKVNISVRPQLIKKDDILYNIDFEKNGVVIDGELSGKHLFAGNGAGSFPTGSAVLNDLKHLKDGFRYNYSRVPNSFSKASISL